MALNAATPLGRLAGEIPVPKGRYQEKPTGYEGSNGAGVCQEDREIYVYVDSHTGEIDRTRTVIPDRRKARFRTPHFTGFQAVWHELALHIAAEKVTRMDLAVLAEILAHVSYDNRVIASQGTIAKALGRKQQQISRHMKRLVRIGWLQYTGEVEAPYRVCPDLAWKGAVGTWQRRRRIDMGKVVE